MAWYWPSIDDASSAESAIMPAVGVSAFIAAITALGSVLSIVYQKPIFGLDGWGLVDAILFGVASWRIRKLSRGWAIAGLVLYLLEVAYKLLSSSPSAIGVLAVVFILTFIAAIRGTFAYHRYLKVDQATPEQPAPSS